MLSSLLVFIIIAIGLVYIITLLPLPAPWDKILQALVVLILLVYAIRDFLPGFGL